MTEFIDHFEQAGEKISDMVLLVTEERLVKEGAEVARIALKLKYPKVRVHKVFLPFEDTLTTEQNLEFMRIAARVIRDEREKYGAERIYLNVAGGRKNMCITLSLLAQMLGVEGVFHVVNRNYKEMNVNLERLRHEISQIYEAKSEEEKIRIYKRNAERFDPLFFPPKNEYELIRIPTLPFPEEYLGEVLITLLGEGQKHKERLASFGLLEKHGSKYFATDFGRKLATAILGREQHE